MDYKHSCVVDATGRYQTIVKVDFVTRYLPPPVLEDGTPDFTQAETVTEWVPYCYTLLEGERLVDTQQPLMRLHAGAKGFVDPCWDDGAAAWVEGATAAEVAAWELEHPDPKTVEDVRAETLAALGVVCKAEIAAGCDVTLSDGSTGHVSLTGDDQINLIAANTEVMVGKLGQPYHIDKEMCEIFPAADILLIVRAVTAHKLYHTTYCNHCNVWARRAETREELAGITYGVALPADLATHMEGVLRDAANL